MSDKKKPRIQPRLFKGTRDSLPEDMIPRQRVLDVIREHAERCGFAPLMTPSIEHLDVLTGKYGSEAEHLIFRLAYKDGNTAALRYDLTVPLSRVMAMYPSLPKPFKRYQVQPVWRAEKPQKGRYREFVQCDLDTVGTTEMTADAEILALTAGVLGDLGLERFVMRVNHRMVLDALLDTAGIPKNLHVFVIRTIDKLDKVGDSGVREILLKGPSGGDGGITEDQADLLLKATGLTGSPADVLPEVRRMLGDHEGGVRGLSELSEVFSILSWLDVPEACYSFDMSLARGLDYYTGPVFETVVPELSLGSIAGGGRYDDLIGRFGKDAPAVGTTLGLDRIVVAMQELKLIQETKTATEILVCVVSPDQKSDAFKLGGLLRRSGVRTEVFLESASLKKQFTYANKTGIPYVGLLGADEVEKGVVTVKDLAKSEQTEVPRENLVHWIRARMEKVG